MTTSVPSTTSSIQNSGINQMFAEADRLIALGTPEQLLMAQAIMSKATMLMTANSEVIKAMGEGQKSIAQNMSV